MSEVGQGPRIEVGQMTDADLKEAQMGPTGNPSYEYQFGLTSTPLGQGMGQQKSLAELELEAAQAQARALNPMAYATPELGGQTPQELEELSRFKKLYGESENEKGALRAQLAAMQEAFNGLTMQLQEAPLQQAQPSFNPYNPQPQYRQPIGDPFADIGDEDVIQGKQVKRLINETVGPALMQTWQQAQDAQAKLAALERAQVQQAKLAAGIDQMTEWRLIGKNPWLKGLPEANRVQAMVSLKQQEQAMQMGQPQPAVAHPAVDTAQRLVKQTTYIERGSPNVPDTSTQDALNAAYERDAAFAMSKPVETGERAQALRLLAQKYNLKFGNPSDLAR